jgi:hypothetical protein
MALASAFSTTIRGRDAELAALGDQLARVRSGSGSVLLIEGAAEMGKSRLIAEGVRMAERLSLPAGRGQAVRLPRAISGASSLSRCVASLVRSTRELTSSFANTCLRCVFTVCGDTKSRSAISRFVRPVATS